MIARRTPVVLVTAWALALAGLALVAGRGWEHWRLGSDPASTQARVESAVRSRVLSASRRVQSVALRIAAEPALLDTAPTDERATRGLFDLVDAALDAEGDQAVSVTVYSLRTRPLAARPLAWGGRPSDLRPERLNGPAALLVNQGPSGLHLVAIQPVVLPVPGGTPRRVGVVAAEQVLSASSVREGVLPSATTFQLDTPVVPVSVQILFGEPGGSPAPNTFIVSGPGGEPLLEATVSPTEVANAHRRVRRWTLAFSLVLIALALGAWAAPLLDRRRRSKSTAAYLAWTSLLAGQVAAVRLLLEPLARLLPLAPGSLVASDAAPVLRGLIATPSALLFTGMAAVAVVGLVFDAAERMRIARRGTRSPVGPSIGSAARFGGAQLLLGGLMAALVLGWQGFLKTDSVQPAFDVLGFSLARSGASRVAAPVALVLLEAAVFWGGVVLLRVGLSRWRIRRAILPQIAVPFTLWLAPLAIAVLTIKPGVLRWQSVMLGGAMALVAAMASRWVTRVRRASRVSQIILVGTVFVGPAVLLYPTLVASMEENDRRVIETRFAPEVLHQREELKGRTERSLAQIDRWPLLAEAVTTLGTGVSPTTDVAFAIWSQTDLAAYRISSAIEVYGTDGLLVSRFALNLPEFTRTPQRWREDRCTWFLFEEVSPLGSEERRLLHAGRDLCRPGEGPETATGSIVVHVTLDFDTLSFISSQSPYFELFRKAGQPASEPVPSRGVEFVVYGWSRMPTYSSTAGAWTLDEALFSRIYRSREPFWTEMDRGGRAYHVYFQNNRWAIYALGYPAISMAGHLTSMAGLITLAGGTFVVLVVLFAGARRVVGGRPSSARALWREVRASFYRKLFLAFVAASILPALTLAFVTRTFVATRLRSDVESLATRTTTIAQRVVNDYGVQQLGETSTAPGFDDDILVLISRFIDQDVNIYNGAQLVATSKRDLFASGLLPTRTPAALYRAVALEGRPTFVGTEQVGPFLYLLASAPVRPGDPKLILAVMFTSRQRDIEREVAELDRRIVLAALIFVLIGAAIGYTMAERIADPVNRLTRAARRIARGDLDARTATRTSDELGRLVEAFNSMAAELQRQRAQLERTHRLEAWAEMARQVAHDIKNPLTPIQLSAEHLRHVHRDRGQPLAPVLDECIDSILSQVRLLRQIASDFSSYASSPVPRPVRTPVASLVEEVLGPYRAGVAHRVNVEVDVAHRLPPLLVDRTLLGRALSNLIDNALHAMPGSGTLRITAGMDPAASGRVLLTVSDTGVGMGPEDLSRVFQPYFSTKATGTGLGLAIARRNVELSGGTISVDSQKGRGTTLAIRLPIVDEPEQGR